MKSLILAISILPIFDYQDWVKLQIEPEASARVASRYDIYLDGGLKPLSPLFNNHYDERPDAMGFKIKIFDF